VGLPAFGVGTQRHSSTRRCHCLIYEQTSVSWHAVTRSGSYEATCAPDYPQNLWIDTLHVFTSTEPARLTNSCHCRPATDRWRPETVGRRAEPDCGFNWSTQHL